MVDEMEKLMEEILKNFSIIIFIKNLFFFFFITIKKIKKFF